MRDIEEPEATTEALSRAAEEPEASTEVVLKSSEESEASTETMVKALKEPEATTDADLKAAKEEPEAITEATVRDVEEPEGTTEAEIMAVEEPEATTEAAEESAEESEASTEVPQVVFHDNKNDEVSPIPDVVDESTDDITTESPLNVESLVPDLPEVPKSGGRFVNFNVASNNGQEQDEPNPSTHFFYNTNYQTLPGARSPSYPKISLYPAWPPVHYLGFPGLKEAQALRFANNAYYNQFLLPNRNFVEQS